MSDTCAPSRFIRFPLLLGARLRVVQTPLPGRSRFPSAMRCSAAQRVLVRALITIGPPRPEPRPVTSPEHAGISCCSAAVSCKVASKPPPGPDSLRSLWETRAATLHKRRACAGRCHGQVPSTLPCRCFALFDNTGLGPLPSWLASCPSMRSCWCTDGHVCLERQREFRAQRWSRDLLEATSTRRSTLAVPAVRFPRPEQLDRLQSCVTRCHRTLLPQRPSRRIQPSAFARLRAH